MTREPERSTTGKTRLTLRRLLKPKPVQELTRTLKEKGFRGFLKEKGWKLVVALVLFYLIRDSILYLVLPYLAARGLLGC